MKKVVAKVAALTLGFAPIVSPAYAGGWVADTFIKPIAPNVAKQLDQTHEKLGKPLDNPATFIMPTTVLPPVVPVPVPVVPDMGKSLGESLENATNSLGKDVQNALDHLDEILRKGTLAAKVTFREAVIELGIVAFVLFAAAKIFSVGLSLLSRSRQPRT